MLEGKDQLILTDNSPKKNVRFLLVGFFLLVISVLIYFFVINIFIKTDSSPLSFISNEKLGSIIKKINPIARKVVSVRTEDSTMRISVENDFNSERFLQGIETQLSPNRQITSNLTNLQVVLTDVPQNYNLAWSEGVNVVPYSGYSSKYLDEGELEVTIFLNKQSLLVANWSELAISRHAFYLTTCAIISFLDTTLTSDKVAEVATQYVSEYEWGEAKSMYEISFN